MTKEMFLKDLEIKKNDFHLAIQCIDTDDWFFDWDMFKRIKLEDALDCGYPTPMNDIW